jgi:hypothetical protein
MAYSEQIPIYKSAYDLCLWLEQVVRRFSRYRSSLTLRFCATELPFPCCIEWDGRATLIAIMKSLTLVLGVSYYVSH